MLTVLKRWEGAAIVPVDLKYSSQRKVWNSSSKGDLKEMPLISKVAKVTLLFQYNGSDSADIYVVTAGCKLLLIRAF